eukprot:6238472-Lingulodinium_polyedra.AAC.1
MGPRGKTLGNWRNTKTRKPPCFCATDNCWRANNAFASETGRYLARPCARRLHTAPLTACCP